MSLTGPRDKVVITCAVTGNITTRDQHPGLPATPQEIAEASLAAADGGAAAVHIHVRDPVTAAPSMELDLYREVVDRIREHNAQLIINLTTGPGGRFVPSQDTPRIAGPGTTLIAAEQRVEHIAVLKPDICTLDLNTMVSGKAVVINMPDAVRRMARVIRGAGVIPEIELFDSGDIALCNDLVADGTLAGPVLCSFVMGVKYGFQPSPETVLYARGLLPPGSQFTAFGIGRSSFQMAAQSVLAGGHVRTGLEDTIFIERGRLAPSNAALVERVRIIVEALGVQVASPQDARSIFGLPDA